MANNIGNNKPVAICDQSKMDVTKYDIHKVVNNIEPLINLLTSDICIFRKNTFIFKIIKNCLA